MGFSIAPICATMVRFSMTFETTLSDAATTERRFLASLATDSAGLAAHFLIANPRLEFRLTRRKISPLIFSNREEIAFFHVVFNVNEISAPPASARPSLPIPSLNDPEPKPISRAQTHTRKPPRPRRSAPLATSHSPLATLFPIFCNRPLADSHHETIAIVTKEIS